MFKEEKCNMSFMCPACLLLHGQWLFFTGRKMHQENNYTLDSLEMGWRFLRVEVSTAAMCSDFTASANITPPK